MGFIKASQAAGNYELNRPKEVRSCFSHREVSGDFETKACYT